MPERAAIYARVSSAKQRDAESVQSQLLVLRAYVERQGWRLAGEYVDDGKSAKTGQLEKRDGFSRLVADARAGRFDILVVLDVSRLTRTDDIEERAQILGPFQRAGIDIHTPSGGRQDLRSFFGQLYVQLQAIFSAEDNRKRAEATVAGKVRAIAQNRKPAGPTPYGLRYDRATGVFSVDPAEAAVIREMFARVAAGEPCSRLEYDFNVRGVPTCSHERSNRASQWRSERIHHLVTSPTYRGEWMVDKAKRIALKVPAIVDDLTWYRAQDELKSWQRRGLRRTKHVYLCEEIAVCTVCPEPTRIGISTHGYSTAAGRVRHGYYICAHRRRPPFGMARCDLPMRRVDEVDSRLWEAVHDLLTVRWPELRDMIAERQRAAGTAASDWAADVVSYRGKLERLDKAESVVLGQYRRGLVTEKGLEDELKAIARERSFLLQQVDAAQRAMAGAHPGPSLLDAIGALRSVLRKAGPDVRRDIVRALIPGKDGYNVRLGPHSVEATVALTSRVALVGQGSSIHPHESKRQSLWVSVELVA